MGYSPFDDPRKTGLHKRKRVPGLYTVCRIGGAVKKEIVFPYQEELDVDLSFAAPLLRRADRNKSEGDPAFPQQEVEIWSSGIANKITLPVFHCDETYWDTLGVDSALPQPPKPRIVRKLGPCIPVHRA